MSSADPVVAFPSRHHAVPGRVIDALREAYDVGDWHDWERAPKGRSNISLFVTATTGRYVLRCPSPAAIVPKSLDAITFEAALIDFLRRKGYPAPQLLRSRGGELYAQHEGVFYLMTVFIPGEPYDGRNLNHLRAVGRELGRYHRLVRNLPGPHHRRATPLTDLDPSRVEVLDEVQRAAGRFLTGEAGERFRDDIGYIRDHFGRTHRLLTEIYPGLTRLVIQGSLGRSAVIFDGDSVAGVLDYERATLEVRGIDLAYTVKAFCRVDGEAEPDCGVGFDCERCRTMLASYAEEEPLPAEERAALPLIFREQRLLKVLNKCGNFLAKDAVAPQREKDALKLATVAQREATRLRWLEMHERELLAAFLEK